MSERVEQRFLEAEGPDGLRLPLINVDHPAFRVAIDAAALERHAEAFVAEQARTQGSAIRRAFNRFVLPHLLRRSRIGRGLVQARGGVLDGLTTYLMKLGPEPLRAPWASELDRRIASTFPALSLRLRMQDVAELLGDALVPKLRDDLDRPLWLLSLAGGPAMESLNALLRVQRADATLLQRRAVRVVVLDRSGPTTEFGRAALERWRAPGGPLDGVRVELERAPYDWAEPSGLDRALAGVPGSALLAVSSEGGLFDYADDVSVGSQLRAIAARGRPDTVVCGTLSSPGRAGTLLIRGSLVAVQPRALQAFATLAARSGWDVADARERPMSTAFSLRASQSSEPPAPR